MQYVSTAYKSEMQKLRRGKSSIKVSIGLISQEAQNSAEVTTGNYTIYSNLQKPFTTDELITKQYASFEQRFGKVDGSMFFLPKSAEKYYNNGIVTESLCDGSETPNVKIVFDVDDYVNIKGLTIDFGENYPSKFTITTNNKTVEYANAKQIFTTEDVFNETTEMTLTAKTMEKGIGRLRILSMTMGIGIVFGDEKVISAELKNTISPVAEALPTISFSVKINNRDHYYNVDNPDSAINYMETGQIIQLWFGYTLESGTVEWVKSGTLCIKEWSADNTTAIFKAVDEFEYMQDKYKKGEYVEAGITLYDLAEDVLRDAGKKTSEYWLDPYLKTLVVNNPLPEVQHKECLQLIANAARSVLMQSSDGLVVIKSSFVPDQKVTANGQAEYSNVSNILNDSTYNEYASFEQKFGKTDGTQFFLPRGSIYLDCGFTSADQAGADGAFEINPVITLTLESAHTFYNLTLLFGTAVPEEFIVTTYSNAVKVEKLNSKAVGQKTVIGHEFLDIDKITIEFTKVKAYDRIHIQRLSIGDATDYTIDYNTLLKPPTGTRIEQIKQLDITRTIYTKGTVQKDLLTESITISAISEYEFSFRNAVHDLIVIISAGGKEVDYGATVEEYKSYWCKIKIANPPEIATAAKIVIKGYEYSITTATVTNPISNVGSTESWDNPLISSAEDAEKLAEWLGKYYRGKNEYTLNYRGDPILNCNDLVFLESEYDSNLMVRLEETQLKYTGSITGTLKARKEA